jgi:hypothetical protein
MEFRTRPDPTARDSAYMAFRERVLNCIVSVYGQDDGDYLIDEIYMVYTGFNTLSDYEYATKTAGTPFRTPEGQKSNDLAIATESPILSKMAEKLQSGRVIYKKEIVQYSVKGQDGSDTQVIRYRYKSENDDPMIISQSGASFLNLTKLKDLFKATTVNVGTPATFGSRAKTDYFRNIIKSMYNLKKAMSQRTSRISTSTGADPLPTMSRTVKGTLGDDRCARGILQDICDFLSGISSGEYQARKARMMNNLKSLCSILGTDERGFGGPDPRVSNTLSILINQFHSGQDMTATASELYSLIEDSDPDYTQVDIRYYQVPTSEEAMADIATVKFYTKEEVATNGEKVELSNRSIWMAMCLAPANMDYGVAHDLCGDLRYINYYKSGALVTPTNVAVAGRLPRRKGTFFGGKIATSRKIASGLNVNFKSAAQGVNAPQTAVVKTVIGSKPKGFLVTKAMGGYTATEYYFPHQKVENLPYFMSTGSTMNVSLVDNPYGRSKIIPVPPPIVTRLMSYKQSAMLYSNPGMLADPSQAALIQAGTGNSSIVATSGYYTKAAGIGVNLADTAVAAGTPGSKAVEVEAGVQYDMMTGMKRTADDEEMEEAKKLKVGTSRTK